MLESLLGRAKRRGGMLLAKSPYVGQTNRLADVIAAIQVMGTYKYYKLDIGKWARRVRDIGEPDGDSNSDNDERSDSKHTQIDKDKWRAVFDEHPEFFRLGDKEKRASLVWRRSYPKFFDTKEFVEITTEEFKRHLGTSLTSQLFCGYLARMAQVFHTYVELFKPVPEVPRTASGIAMSAAFRSP